MNTHFHITSSGNTTHNKTQIDHIWTNAPTHQCHVGSKQAYSTNQNPIYFAFKLPNYVLQFCQPLMNKCYIKKDFNANIRY
jgi:predicted metal-binding transcription factor (methanogenesis marker protein 9)